MLLLRGFAIASALLMGAQICAAQSDEQKENTDRSAQCDQATKDYVGGVAKSVIGATAVVGGIISTPETGPVGLGVAAYGGVLYKQGTDQQTEASQRMLENCTPSNEKTDEPRNIDNPDGTP